MLKARNLVPFLVVALMGLAPEVARGEGFLDFAVGGTFTQNHDVKFKSGGVSTTVDGDFDDSWSTGVRGGYWFDPLPWIGVGGMVSYFEPDVEPDNVAGFGDQDIGVVPLTALLMLRIPLLMSDAAPHGHIQPYLNIGPGAFFTFVDEHHDDDDDTVDVGVDLHAGVTWMFNSHFGMFTEYRFTHYGFDLERESRRSGDFEMESTLDSHHILAGFAWHFE
jgi:opacity protein-like surface antigen